MSDILLYFLNLFLNTSASILYFFYRQIVCSITILFLGRFLLYSFSSCYSLRFLFFLIGMYDSRSWKSFITKVSKVKYINNLFRRESMILFIDIIIMFSSFPFLYLNLSIMMPWLLIIHSPQIVWIGSSTTNI